MEFSLLFGQRISIESILPVEGDYTAMLIKRDILEKIKITGKETELYEIRAEGNRVFWNKKGEEAVLAVEFTDSEVNIIQEELKKRNNERKLNDSTALLYTTFVARSEK